MDKLNTYKTFIALVEEGSFIKTAEKLNTSKSVVSKHIAFLEEHTEVRLVNRTTRSVSITEEGKIFYHKCIDILEHISSAENELKKQSSNLNGLLRISAPQSFGLSHIVPICNHFKREHSHINIDLSLCDEHVDLIEETVDIAIRVGSIDDPDLVKSM